jgi:hypothetical protein
MTGGCWRSTCLVSTALGMAGLMAACGSPTASAPSATRPLDISATPISVAPFSVSGTVFEHTATETRPLAGLHFTVTGRTYYLPAGPLAVMPVDVTSDANGRYEATGFPGRASIRMTVSPEQGYRAPCPLAIPLLGANSVLDLHVVSNASLSTGGIPASLPTHFPTVSGMVSETVSGSVRPVGGAALDLLFDPEAESGVFASTLSDPTGRYVVCVPPPGGNDQQFWVRALKNGYQPATQSLVISFDERLDFALGR